ncbi:MAG TPA: VOC family protein [Saprospiraceae bacterium]|nr:VOC family protein [Saprospiraceae bacterium]
MIQTIEQTEIILFVKDQNKAAGFYERILGIQPSLHVPGMTEFRLSSNCLLGLMPQSGISRLLQLNLTAEENSSAFPKCELYLLVKDAAAAIDHAISCGASLVSAVQARDWGDLAGYLKDPDGNIIAFASKNN